MRARVQCASLFMWGAAIAVSACANPQTYPAGEMETLPSPGVLSPAPPMGAANNVVTYDAPASQDPAPAIVQFAPAQLAQVGGPSSSAQQGVAGGGGAVTPSLPTDPWPRQIDLANASVLIYSPQVNSWDGNTLDMRSAVAVKAADTGAQTFGVVWATARTQVDRVDRTVTLEDLKITRVNFPALPDNGAAYLAQFQQRAAAAEIRTISLDRLQAALAVAGVKPAAVTVRNDPPRIIVSNSPAILVPIAGAPVVKPVPDDSRFERVINTGALIVRKRLGDTWYLHVYDGWMSAPALGGPWTTGGFVPFGLDDLAGRLNKAGKVDLLDGGPNANPKPALANGAPAIYTSEQPAELIVFKGQPDFVPIAGTQLLWAANTTADVIVSLSDNYTYLLLSGRWFCAPGLNGPWSYVANSALPADFARIPKDSPAGVVLATVAGTPQAQEAAIENSVPQTATVPRANGPAFVPSFDGAPKFRPIAGTPLSYVVNSPYPIIGVAPNSFYAVKSGVWFAAPRLTGPWAVATAVPAVIYSIPSSSPLHYVTYVRVYGYTPQVVYVGYTPGYLGTVVTADGTVVYGTGYAYDPWIGAIWYPAPVTYGVAAAPVYNPAVGYTFGFALGLATAAWATPYYYGGAFYHPGYWGAPCCGSATANVYRNWGSAASYGTRTWYANGSNIGTVGSGNYSTARGVSGSYSGYRNYNYASGWAQQGYSRSGTGPAGGTGSVSRNSGYNTYTGQRYYNSSAGVTGPGGSSVDRDVNATYTPGQGGAVSRSTTVDNARTGQTSTYSSGRDADDRYAGRDGTTYSNSGSGWQRQGGGTLSGSDASDAAREQQARNLGGNRAQSFGGGGGDDRAGRFGGEDRFGGRDSGAGGFGNRFSGGFGDRFGGGGFGGFRGGGFRR